MPSSGCGSPSTDSFLLVDGDRGLRLPNFKNASALSFPLDCGRLLGSTGGDENPDAADDASDMLDWLASGDRCELNWYGSSGDIGELGAKDWLSGNREARERFRR